MSEISDAIKVHEDQQHESLLTRQEIEAMDTEARLLIGEVADEILGPMRSAFLGGGRDTTQGLKERQTKLIEWQQKTQGMLDNGGLPSKLTSRDRATVVVAAIAGAGSVVLGVIEYLGKT